MCVYCEAHECLSSDMLMLSLKTDDNSLQQELVITSEYKQHGQRKCVGRKKSFCIRARNKLTKF
jgi:hypothetical protein